jgi:type VI secretion system protein ImpK
MTAPSGATGGQLALALQEVLTVTGRVRDGRVKPTDAKAFRGRVKELVASANDEGIAIGYSARDVGLALYAAVALLDESVFNSGLDVSAEWARKPLQDELFGDHRAGENFFQHVSGLMQQDDSPGLADLLEVYQLCLLLGFRGKYASRGPSATASGDPGELASISRRLGERIARIRGEPPPLSAAWRPTGEVVATRKDPWVRRLVMLTASLAVVTGALFVLYRLSLPAGIPA